ncbi:MAG TPA: hypothetical protein VK988_01310 [Acidimicrobiales bacterium]|nr:hypothetical protein [Acidimicrobiales bacterium]
MTVVGRTRATRAEGPSVGPAGSAEYDRLGQERFLGEYGFGEVTRYLLRVDGRLYDSKAIVGDAYGYEHRAKARCPTPPSMVACRPARRHANCGGSASTWWNVRTD